MISEELIQRFLLYCMSWYHGETDIYKSACHVTKIFYQEYAEMLCLESIPDEEVQREISTQTYYPDTAPPYPGVLLMSGSSPANSESMMARKAFFLSNGFAVMILDSYTRARILEDCFRNKKQCAAYQQLTKNQWNIIWPQSFQCPVISFQPGGSEESLLLKSYLNRITLGYIFSPAERAHDLYEALRIFRKDEQVDSENLAVVGYSHGGATVLESLTFSGSKIPPPGDAAFSEEEHSLEGVKAAVAYYPNCRPGTYFEHHANIKNIDLQLHLSNRDEYVKPEFCQSTMDSIKKSKPDQKLETFRYDELHAFDMKEYSSAYNPKSGELAIDRTLKFIRNALDPKYQ